MGSGTLTTAEAARSAWDVLVIGAGPAGTMAALGLARAGHRTLLVEAKRFPRDKVCGGCLQQRGRSLLAELGLEWTLRQAHSVPVDELHVEYAGRQLVARLHGMCAVRRATWDDLLVRAAIEAGVAFLPETTARVSVAAEAEVRSVILKSAEDQEHAAAARVVICADGLSHPSLAGHAEFTSRIEPDSRVGAHALLDHDGAVYPAGRLTMAVSRWGYAGLTVVETGTLNVAAALDAKALRHGQRPAVVVRQILESCRLPVPPSLDGARWTGTPALTRQSCCFAAHRLFLVGDAVGYVEPFTGEGMTWALASAAALVPLASEGCNRWTDKLTDQWRHVLQQTVTTHQGMCRLLSRLSRHPQLVGWTVNLCRLLPPLRRLAVSRVCGTPSSHLAHAAPRT